MARNRDASYQLLEQVVARKIKVLYGLSLFDDHDTGIRLDQDGAAILSEAARALKDFPAWTVVLEGHCPGRPEENNKFRESIGEEAADLCKAYLLDAGVRNTILCEGRGCEKGLGMCVQMSTIAAEEPRDPPPILPFDQYYNQYFAINSDITSRLAHNLFDKIWPEVLPEVVLPEILPEEEQPSMIEHAETEAESSFLAGTYVFGPSELQPNLVLAETQPNLMLAETQPNLMFAETVALKGPSAADADDFVDTLQKSITEHLNAGDEDFEVPDTSNLSMEEKRLAMNALFGKILKRSIEFEPNNNELRKRGHKTVRELAKVLTAFPTFAVKCVGHCKGKPSDNNEAKRQLSQDRAESVKAALLSHGVHNEIICASFGSALGRGMCVQLNALSPQEVEEGTIRIPDATDLTRDQQEASLNQLLHESLEKGLAFEPNKASIHEEGAPVIRQVANILKGFPDFAIRCEGHAKGTPADDNDAKRQLSQVRAEAVRAAVLANDVSNRIICIGKGSSQGMGMCVRMFATDPDKAVEIPDTSGMLEVEKAKLLDDLLAQALERNIDFEPNKAEIPPAGHATVHNLARILLAFPGFAMCCEGHTKGSAIDHSDAKRKLSQARAEAVKAGILSSGVTNRIVCRGAGSSQGRGACVRLFTIDPDELKKEDIVVPETEGMSQEEQEALFNVLLEKALQSNIEFEPNVYEVPTSAADTIVALANVLKAFPGFAVRCEGHAKGQPADNTEAKKKLSYMRAEALKAALKKEGVQNGIRCVGVGCTHGLGMRVRMFVIDPAELKKDEVDIPDNIGQSKEERAKLLNELLAKALEKNINFEPNRADIQAAGISVVEQLGRVLAAFNEFTVQCEGHAKGKPADNNDAKMRLSQVRAEAVREALLKQGVQNKIICMGRGSEEGLGMCVRMFTNDVS